MSKNATTKGRLCKYVAIDYPRVIARINFPIMLRMIANWFINALGLLIVSRLISGFDLTGLRAALLAALVIGFINATLGLLLKILTFPLTLLSLGVFWFVINAIMLELAAAFVPGFRIRGFAPAFVGAIVLSIANLVLKSIAGKVRN
jgi:putative membrane protein